MFDFLFLILPNIPKVQLLDHMEINSLFNLLILFSTTNPTLLILDIQFGRHAECIIFYSNFMELMKFKKITSLCLG